MPGLLTLLQPDLPSYCSAIAISAGGRVSTFLMEKGKSNGQACLDFFEQVHSLRSSRRKVGYREASEV
jgi:hypothetical protein